NYRMSPKFVGCLLSLIFYFFFAQSLGAFAIDRDAIQFRYLEIEGSQEADCKHGSSNGIDWEVSCKVANKELKYLVHLVLSYYPMTNEGFAAYELLYWVTDSNSVSH